MKGRPDFSTISSIYFGQCLAKCGLAVISFHVLLGSDDNSLLFFYLLAFCIVLSLPRATNLKCE